MVSNTFFVFLLNENKVNFSFSTATLFYNNLNNCKWKKMCFSKFFLLSKNWALCSIVMFFDISFGIRAMYNFQETFSSMITPRNVTEISLFISKLFSVTAVSFNGVLSLARSLWKSVKFVLRGFREILLKLNQSLTCFSSWQHFLIKTS